MDDMDIKKKLDKNQTIMVVVPSIEYNDAIVQVTRQLSHEPVCYVTLNKTFDSLTELFTKNKVNTENIVFIDAISKSFTKRPDQTDKCYYVSSPGALTELSIAISKFLRHGFEYFVFDSVTTAAIYENKPAIAKFISSLVNKIKAGNTKAVFFGLNIKEQENLLKQCYTFVDDVIEMN